MFTHGVSTGSVLLLDSSSSFKPMSRFANSNLAVSGERGRLTNVQLDLLSSRIPTTSSSLGETSVHGVCSSLNGLGFGSGDSTSGLHLISPNLLFPK